MPTALLNADQRFASHETLPIDSEVTAGIIIVGEAQAGKTTANKIIAGLWPGFANTPVLEFTNSNGFRGLTSVVLQRAGIDTDQPVPKEHYAELLDQYVSDEANRLALPALLDSLYRQPLTTEELRNPAVHSAVAYTSEHSLVRPEVNKAGADFLRDALAKPELVGLDEKPGLVILDARNNNECRDKFDRAGVRAIGTLVLTCPEIVVAKRKLPAGTSETEIEAEAARLRERNQTDRQREIGRMTLPPDFVSPIVLDRLIPTHTNSPMTEKAIVVAGRLIAAKSNAALVVRTDKIDKQTEATALGLAMSGMLLQLEVGSRRN